MTDVPRHDVPNGGRSGFAMVEDRQVHYLEWGHGGHPGVLCLHGGGQTAYMFEELGLALAGRAHVVAPDLPGHGDSDLTGLRLGDGGGVGAIHEAFAATLPALMDEFGLERAVVIGGSLGGMTAISLGDLVPERVAGIVLIDVGHRLEPDGVRKIIDFMTAHESFESLDEAAVAIAEYLPRRGPVRPESLTRNLRQRPDGRWEWKHGVGRRMRERREAGEDVPHPADNLDAVTVGIEDAAARLRCPVLVLRGSESDVLSAEAADDLVQVIPDARLEIVDKAGHLAAGDNPHSTNALVVAFLDEIAWA